MHFPASLLLLASATLSLASPVRQTVFASTARGDELELTGPAPALDRQTKDQAAVSARRMIHSHPTGTLGTVFPEANTQGLAGSPFALMEYHAPHPTIPSSLLYLLMPISTSVRNVLASEGHHATVTVQNSKGVANDERVALIGSFTLERNITLPDATVYACQYVKYHPDAAAWLPGTPETPHFAFWATFTPEEIYYVGGFGNTKYIGWIERELWDEVEV